MNLNNVSRREFLTTMGAAGLSVALLASCGKNTVMIPAVTGTGIQFKWPDALHFAATGDSGAIKVQSWASVMQADLKGPLIRVVTEAAWTNTYRDMGIGGMVLSQIDKSTLRDCIEARNEYAMPDGGPWMAGLVWVDSLADTGFMVRGGSKIFKPEDIKPGTKFAIWNDQSATMTPFLSLLAWAGVAQKDIVWVNTGDYDACARAVADGRADLSMTAPVSPAVSDAAASPGGIRYVSLDPADNPAGARAFLNLSPLYNFGPITVGPDSARGTWGIISYKYLASNLSSDNDLVYNMAKWLDVNYDKYKASYDSNTQMTLNDLITVLQTTYVPVHPGLAKYLTDKGIWNADYEKRNQANTAIFRQYLNAYQDAMAKAAALKIDVKANNDKWIQYWEDYKLANQIPMIEMHISLTQDAPVVMPAGYAPATTAIAATIAPATTAPPATTALPATTTPVPNEIPFTLVSVLNDAGNAPHPGDNVTVTGKTTPGATVKILFTYFLSATATGTPSAYPPAPDNTQTAGADGLVKFTWNINNHIPAGKVIYTFSITLNGQTTTVDVNQTI